MQQNAILKINKMGKAGQIIANIGLAFIGMVGVLLFIFMVAAGNIPKDFAQISLEGNADVLLNLEEDRNVDVLLNLQEDGFVTYMTDADLQEEEIASIVYESIDNVSEGSLKVERIDDTTMRLNAKYDMTQFTVHDLTWLFAAGLLQIIMTWITVWFIRRLCKAFHYCVSPFEENVIHKMKQFAFSLIPWVVLSSVADVVGEKTFRGTARFGFSVNMEIVVAILIIFALTYIFQYGAVLQQESDETL